MITIHPLVSVFVRVWFACVKNTWRPFPLLLFSSFFFRPVKIDKLRLIV